MNIQPVNGHIFHIGEFDFDHGSLKGEASVRLTSSSLLVRNQLQFQNDLVLTSEDKAVSCADTSPSDKRKHIVLVYKCRNKSPKDYPHQTQASKYPTITIFKLLPKVLERFLGTVPDNVHYQQTILSMYLSCSGFSDADNKCLDRVVCEYSNPESKISQEERDVISM